MKRLLAWLFLLLPMGGQSLWGQSTDRQAQINFLLNSEALTAEDIARADKDQPFLIDRWHLLATTGWKTSTFPEGKGDPPYPVLTLNLWQEYSPFDLELLGHIHRSYDRFSRYRIGDTRTILTLYPARDMNRKMNNIRMITTASAPGQ